MSKHFYKDIQLIRACKICGVQFQVARGSTQAKLRLCRVHLHEYDKKNYATYIDYYKSSGVKIMKFTYWKTWVIKNQKRRRQLALESYHRRKNVLTNALRPHRKNASMK